MELWTIGYSYWPTSERPGKMIAALKERGVTLLADVRLSPCSANVIEGHQYGPKAWTLQAGNAGIARLARDAGIAYEWLVELGNPQRQDHEMKVLRHHLAHPEEGWPVHRGLALLADRVRRPDQVVAILCTCAEASTCHRTVVAEALRERHFGGKLSIRKVV